MTKPTKTLDELVTIFNSALLHDIEFVRVRKDFVVALIADRARLLAEVERLKGPCCPRCGESTHAPGELCRNCPSEPPQEKGYGPR